MALGGAGCAGGIHLTAGDVIYAEAEDVSIETCDTGLVCLLAYESTAPWPKVGWRGLTNEASQLVRPIEFPFSGEISCPRRRAIGVELELTR
jgi:hypothetical protein